jgi:hypothetical protein
VRCPKGHRTVFYLLAPVDATVGLAFLVSYFGLFVIWRFLRTFVFLLDGVCVEFMPGCQVPALAV